MSSPKSRVSFNIPGKTFLLGEYIAIDGKPSIVATTNPNFEIDFFPSQEGTHPFHKESPAGKYIDRHKSFFGKFDIEFYDPYETGGFGASTAQFIAVAAFHKKYDDIVAERPFNFKNPILTLDIWNTYRELFKDQKNSPSGADLIAQIVGGVTSFRADKREWEKLEWPWSSGGPTFYKTPYKINTHEHLEALERAHIPGDELQACVERAIDALKAENFDAFIAESRKFLVIQEQAQLVSPDAREAIVKAAKVPGVTLVRGCGALGADVLAVYGSPREELPGLNKIASIPEDLAYGLLMEAE